MSSEWAEQPANPDNQGIPGRTLAAQREAMGWTVEQVADQLKLAVRQVVALEAGDYASLPGPAVVRGFVRAYAKIVKLDAVPLVAMIALDAPGPTDATGTTLRRDKPASFSEVRFPSHGKRASRRQATRPLAAATPSSASATSPSGSSEPSARRRAAQARLGHSASVCRASHSDGGSDSIHETTSSSRRNRRDSAMVFCIITPAFHAAPGGCAEWPE